MNLLPVTDNDKSWRSLKAQWKRDAEKAGEDFAAFAATVFPVLDPLALENPKTGGLYALYDGDIVHAICQVNRLLMSRYTTPILRARLTTVSPVYDFGSADTDSYAQVLIALFGGVVWLSRDTLAANHIRFHLRSPGDAQFFAALKLSTPLSLFSKFAIRGSWVECTMK
jgi:hypothetical protein